jgi:hypothetical protein
MPLLSKRSFLLDVCSQVSWKGAHKEICEELDAHIQERMERLERLGRTPEEAEKEAVTAMGDPIQIGKELNRYHKPYLSWILNLSWGVIIVSVIYLAVSVLWPWGSNLFVQKNSDQIDKKVLWSIDTDQKQQIDNRVVRLTGADFTEKGDLYVYWETELLEPYRNGWSFSPLYNTFDQDGEKIEVEGSSFSSSSEQIRVYRGLDVETIKSMTFIYDAYHRNMEFVLDLTQRREVQ